MTDDSNAPLPPSSRQTRRLQPAPELAGCSTAQLVNALLQRVESGEVSDLDAASLGWLTAELDLVIGDHPWNRFSAKRGWLPVVRLHPDLAEVAPREGQILPHGIGVIELGAGGMSPLTSLLELVLRGATPAYSLDRDPIERQDFAARAAYRAVLDLIARLRLDMPRQIDWARLRAGHLSGIPDDLWRFIQAPADRCGLPDDSVGLCLSASFLEHVHDPAEVIRESARILRPGGLAIHHIDYSDHRRWEGEHHPLEFLCVEDSQPLIHGCNRIRHHEFVELFERLGFEVRATEIRRSIPIDDALRSRLRGRFAAMSDEQLSVLGAILFLRLPG